METTETLILLEEVLTGKIQDPKVFGKKTSDLHILLTKSNISLLRAANVITARLNSSKKIRNTDYETFKKYLEELLKGNKPKTLALVHYGFSNHLAKKTSKFMFGINKINAWKIRILHSCFSDLRISAYKGCANIAKRKKAGDKIFARLKVLRGKVLDENFQKWKLRTGKKNGKSRGKFKERAVKFNVIKKIIENCSVCIETIAFLKWNMKILDYKEIKSRIIRGVKKTDCYFKLRLFLRWKKQREIFRNLCRKVLGKVFVIGNKQFAKARIAGFSMWKLKKPIRKIPRVSKQNLHSPNSKVDSYKLGSLLNTARLRYFFVKKSFLQRLRSKTLRSQQQQPSKTYPKSLFITKPIGPSLYKLLKTSELRYFYIKYSYFRVWKTLQPSESLSEEEHHHVVKRKRVLTPKLKSESEKELIETIDGISSKSIHFKGISKPKRNFLLRSSKTKSLESENKLGLLVQHLFKIGTVMKNLPNKAISIWKNKSLVYENMRSKKLEVIFTFIQRRALGNDLKKKVILRWRLGKPVVSKSEDLQYLVVKAYDLKNASKGLLQFWKGYSRENCKRFALLKVKILMRTLMKTMRLQVLAGLDKWKNKAFMSKFKKQNTAFTKNSKFEEKTNSEWEAEAKPNKTTMLSPKKNNLQSHKSTNSFSNAFKVNSKILFCVLNNILQSHLKFGLKKMNNHSKKLKKNTKNKLNSMVLLLNSMFAQKAKKCFRPFRIYKSADEIKKKASRRIFANFYNLFDFFRLKWSVWKSLMQKTKLSKLFHSYRALKIRGILDKLVTKTCSACVLPILANYPTNRAQLFLAIILKLVKNALFSAFSRVKRSFSASNANLPLIFARISARSLRATLNKFLAKTIIRVISKLQTVTRTKLHFTIEKLKKRVAISRVIQKLNCAYTFAKFLISKAKTAQKKRFVLWSAQISSRPIKLLKKYMIKLIQFASINYEVAIWKWKYTKSPPSIETLRKLNILFKKLSSISNNYQNRLKQFAIFKFVISSAFSPNAKIQKKNKKTRDFSEISLEKLSFISSGEKSMDFSNLTTNASSRLLKEEVVGISQVGAMDVLGLIFKNAGKRKMTWALTSILIFSQSLGDFDCERERFIEEINLLRYDKHSLLEDNTNLRLHNEALIDNLDRSNADCYTLSLILNEMKISRMTNLFSKMIELPMLDALFLLRLNKEKHGF